MSAFSEDMKPRIDSDDLVGDGSLNPKIRSTGNAILESATAILYEITLGGVTPDREFILRLLGGVMKCRLESGSFNKNPGRPDQITHDDLKAAAAISRLVATVSSWVLAQGVVDLGKKTGWNLSNTGSVYPDALARPWDVAFYKLCDLEEPAYYETATLVGSIIVDAFIKNPSNNRLMWLSLRAVQGININVDLAGAPWKRSMRGKYQNVGNMMGEYYKNPQHPYAVWGQSLPF